MVVTKQIFIFSELQNFRDIDLLLLNLISFLVAVIVSTEHEYICMPSVQCYYSPTKRK